MSVTDSTSWGLLGGMFVLGICLFGVIVFFVVFNWLVDKANEEEKKEKCGSDDGS